MRRVAAPGKRQRDRTVSLFEIGTVEGGPKLGGDGIGHVSIAERELAGDHWQVLQRQLVGVGDQDRVAADLHRELRGADHSGADALARIPDRRQVAAMGEAVNATIEVMDTKVHLKVLLPGMLGMFSGLVRATLQKKGSVLLEDQRP